jgi:HD superfamily phosphodiesterase
MNITKLSELVHNLYINAPAEADPWIDFGYPKHVLVVAANATSLAKRYGANVAFCTAGALLHDVADAVMQRAEEGHEDRSREIAVELLTAAGCNANDQRIIIEDIIGPHSCRERMPESLEAKILATADAVAHLDTDFYLHFAWRHFGAPVYEDYKRWVRERVEKDYHKKIFFDAVREQITPRYEALKLIFSK